MSISTSKPRDRWTAALFAVVVALVVFHLFRLKRDLISQNVDMKVFYLPWFDHIVAYGRWNSLEASFANYSPPYIYFLSLISFLNRVLSPTVLIKLVNLPFVLGAGWLAFDICRALKVPKTTSLAVSALLMVSPEVWTNGLRWGQADIMYTFFLLAFYRLVIAGKPVLALALFGTAIAFKLQSIFVGPALFALLLTEEIQLWQFFAVPAAYLAWMVPAALAGRPWKQLLFVYLDQYQAPSRLGMHLPNPLFMLQDSIPLRYVGAATWISLLLASATSLYVVWIYFSRPKMRGPVGLLTMMALCPLIEAYLLPKMHDRYFFAGDAFVILLIAVRPAMWFPALLLQTSAYIVYRQFLLDLPLYERHPMVAPFLMTTLAISLVARQLWQEGKQEPEAR
jgi:Gpi18-like mannosyltransferase